ncbi:MAG: hypothetical protein N2645_16060 [Clostridia bacterium]|nr:hypothetical protein [Clostridia bacterium]
MHPITKSKLLTATYTMIAIILSILFLLRNQAMYLFEFLISYFSYLLFLYIEKKRNIRLENYIKWFYILSTTANSLFGEYFNLFNTSTIFDKLLHMVGTFTFALMAYSLFIKIFDSRVYTPAFIFTITVSLGMAIGVLFEIIEYIADIYLKTLNQPSLEDTNLDLIFNLIGAVLASLLIISNQKLVDDKR